MPIGLPDAGHRLAGPRWASVFMTPLRAALAEEEFAMATAVNVELAGEGISRQAHGLRAKILQPASGHGTRRIVSPRFIPSSASLAWKARR